MPTSVAGRLWRRGAFRSKARLLKKYVTCLIEHLEILHELSCWLLLVFESSISSAGCFNSSYDDFETRGDVCIKSFRYFLARVQFFLGG